MSDHQGKVGRRAPEAVLLLGPTGSGKTPLGDLLEERGLGGRSCAHFDFGRELRRIARAGDPLFGPTEAAFIRQVLDEGALLENEHSHIARKVLTAFLAERGTGDRGSDTGRPKTENRKPMTDNLLRLPNTDHRTPITVRGRPLIVLNGLPRHLGQARDMDCLVAVRAVVYLDCAPGVVLERIRANPGGDRAGRADDRREDVERRRRLFTERTLPLLDHYRGRGADIIRVQVGADTTPDATLRQIELATGADQNLRTGIYHG